MEKLQKQLIQLKTLTELASLINSSFDQAEIRERAIEATTRVLNAEAASLLLLDEATGELYFDVATGEKGGRVKQIRLKKGVGIAGWVAEHGTPLVIHDAQSDPRFFKTADKFSGFVTRNIICVPLKTKARTIGVLEGINKKDGRFDDSDLELTETLANYIAVAIENARLYSELKDTFYSTAETLSETIELRDPCTGGHTKRVKHYSLIIGRYLGLSKAELETVELAAILHDIGKIGIRDDILLKKGRLTEDEMQHMRMHSIYGAELLKSIKQLKDIVPVVRNHHERYDGAGYPDGLSGEDISPMARILTVADSFDAMTTHRPYKKSISTEAALEQLRQYAGTQFDPKVVEAFLQAFADGAVYPHEDGAPSPSTLSTLPAPESEERDLTS
ncbi:MAG TPA: HD domain-containing protein [Nitrospirae bacterium]|nr:HD domain-containing protein [Nitrospirota bacterium]